MRGCAVMNGRGTLAGGVLAGAARLVQALHRPKEIRACTLVHGGHPTSAFSYKCHSATVMMNVGAALWLESTAFGFANCQLPTALITDTGQR